MEKRRYTRVCGVASFTITAAIDKCQRKSVNVRPISKHRCKHRRWIPRRIVMRRRVNIRAQPSALTRSIRLPRCIRVSAVLRNAREKGWRGWRGRDVTAGREGAKDRNVERARWETHNVEGEDGRCALWIRYYSPRLLLPTYQPSHPGTHKTRTSYHHTHAFSSQGTRFNGCSCAATSRSAWENGDKSGKV